MAEIVTSGMHGTTSRRAVLRLFGVGALGASLAGMGLGDAEAKKKGKKKGKPKKNNRRNTAAPAAPAAPNQPQLVLPADGNLWQPPTGGLDLPPMPMAESRGEGVQAAAVATYSAYDYRTGKYFLVYAGARNWGGSYYYNGQYIGEWYLGWFQDLYYGNLYGGWYLEYPNRSIWIHSTVISCVNGTCYRN